MIGEQLPKRAKEAGTSTSADQSDGRSTFSRGAAASDRDTPPGRAAPRSAAPAPSDDLRDPYSAQAPEESSSDGEFFSPDEYFGGDGGSSSSSRDRGSGRGRDRGTGAGGSSGDQVYDPRDVDGVTSGGVSVGGGGLGLGLSGIGGGFGDAGAGAGAGDDESIRGSIGGYTRDQRRRDSGREGASHGGGDAWGSGMDGLSPSDAAALERRQRRREDRRSGGGGGREWDRDGGRS